MKFRVIALCLLLCSLLCLPAFAARDAELLEDFADVLSDGEEQTLRERLEEVSDELDVAVVTVNDLEGLSARGFAENWYDAYGYRADGILLLFHEGFDGNEYYFYAKGKGEDIFDDAAFDELEDACVALLREHEFADAFHAYADTCEELIADYGSIKLFPIIVCIVLGAILSFLIPMAYLKGQLNSVRSQPAAESYVRSGSMVLTKQRDIFLYRRVIRTAKPKNNSSSSGGSGRGGKC